MNAPPLSSAPGPSGPVAEPDEPLPCRGIGAVVGAPLGAVVAVLLGLDATPPSTHGSMLAPIWLFGAFIGACCGFALGALIAWELNADPLRGAGRRGERRLLPGVAEEPLTEADMP